MKTEQQKKFEKLITDVISCEPCVNFRTNVLDDFQLDSDLYYERFCDKVFESSQDKQHKALVIDERGLTYLENSASKPHHVYFKILSDHDFNLETDDIIIYIDLALDHLEKQIQQIRQSMY